MGPRATAWTWVKKTANRVLPRDRFAQSVAVLAGGTALGQIIIALASPILTRLYTPEDFGVLAVYSSMLGILSVVASMRYELAIPLPEKDEDAAALLVLSLGIVVLMSLLTGLGVWRLGGQIVHWANAPAFKPYLWLLPVGVGMVGAYQVFNYWAVRKQAFGRIAQTRLRQGVGAAFTKIALGLLDPGPVGLIVGQVVGQGSGITSLVGLARSEERKLWGNITCARIRYVAGQYRRFPQLSSFSSLLNSAGLQLPFLLFASFYGPQVVGWLALGQKIIGLPISLLGQAVAQVYIGTASKLVRRSGEMRLLFAKTAVRLFFVGVIPIIALGLGGEWLFSLLFGSNWGEAGVYVQLMSGAFLAQFVIVPISQTLNIIERQDLQLIWDLGRLVLVGGTIWGIFQLGGTARQAVIGYSVAWCFAYIALLGLNLWALNSSGQEPCLGS